MEKNNNKKLNELYKFFSDINLLKLPFQNDSNTLNTKFYAELLHIIGLKETKHEGNVYIERCPKGERQSGSLIENTINTLEADDYLYKPCFNSMGDMHEEKVFNVALELCITWINRVLFLKLLEGQVIKYNNNDTSFKFLSANKIKDFATLNELFFRVLAINLT